MSDENAALFRRWSPLTIGPWAILKKTPASNEIFKRVVPAASDGSWNWDL